MGSLDSALPPSPDQVGKLPPLAQSPARFNGANSQAASHLTPEPLIGDARRLQPILKSPPAQGFRYKIAESLVGDSSRLLDIKSYDLHDRIMVHQEESIAETFRSMSRLKQAQVRSRKQEFRNKKATAPQDFKISGEKA